MSRYSRRNFVKTSTGILGVASLGGWVFGCREKQVPASAEWGGFK